MHVSRDQKTAKVWLDPIELEYSRGFARNEFNRIMALVAEHKTQLIEAWHDYFDPGN